MDGKVLGGGRDGGIDGDFFGVRRRKEELSWVSWTGKEKEKEDGGEWG